MVLGLGVWPSEIRQACQAGNQAKNPMVNEIPTMDIRVDTATEAVTVSSSFW
jgi:hypothetical protein